MLHRDKTIGHSLYRVVKHDDRFKIMEIFNDGKSFAKKYSKESWDTADDAIQQLVLISCERYYTDPFHSGGIQI